MGRKDQLQPPLGQPRPQERWAARARGSVAPLPPFAPRRLAARDALVLSQWSVWAWFRQPLLPGLGSSRSPPGCASTELTQREGGSAPHCGGPGAPAPRRLPGPIRGIGFE